MLGESKVASAAQVSGLSAIVLAPLLALLLGGERLPVVAPPAQPHAEAPEPLTGKDDEPASECAARFWEPFALLGGQTRAGSSGKDWSGVMKPRADGGYDIAVQDKRPGASVRSWDALRTATLKQLEKTLGQAPTIQIMIALLPDPLDSGLDYDFDIQLQALRLALESDIEDETGALRDRGHQRDRDWLPWDDRYGSAAQRVQSEACRRELPGVVLFRGTDPSSPSLRVLLVVGESPTAGPHYGALRRALKLAEDLTVADTKCDGSWAKECRINILGPTFSGSADVLRRAIDAHRQPLPEGSASKRSIQLVSATANGTGLTEKLRSEEARLDFQATTVPQAALECAFLEYVKDLGARAAPPNEVGVSTLDGVGILTESGTQFGTGGDGNHCALQSEIKLVFPLQVSDLQTEYERIDRATANPAMMRTTALDVSLVGRKRRDVETHQSTITKYAQDRALSNVLGQISREGIRWLGIRATDTADAIFLARKVRDVAPDVRLAFFVSDTLLLHPEYQRYLLGSLVLTPYPFLGADDFSPRATGLAETGTTHGHHHHAFESAGALGTFNAALALRDAKALNLREYVFANPDRREPFARRFLKGAPREVSHDEPLPIWTTAVGRSGLVPLRVQPAVDCEQTIYGGVQVPAALCTEPLGSDAQVSALRAFTAGSDQLLAVDPDVTPPRFWHFVLAILALIVLVDFVSQRKTILTLREPDGQTNTETSEEAFDHAFSTAQWHLYAFFRRLVLTIMSIHMAVIHCLAMAAYPSYEAWTLRCVFIVVAAMLLAWTALGLLRFARSVGALRRVTKLLHPGEPAGLMQRVWSRVMAWAHFRPARDQATTVHVSHAQLWFVFGLGTACASWLLLIFFLHLNDQSSGRAITLLGLRSLPLLNGVSPVMPILFCLLAGYVWALARCGRTQLLRGLSVMSPNDGVLDGVCTPIRHVLFPAKADGGFSSQERHLVNVLARPSGIGYVGPLFLIAVLPGVLFVLKRPSTLETGSSMLFSALWLVAAIIGVTLLQLVQYWRALDVLLKRVMTHPLGPAFGQILPTLHEPVDAQVSRLPNDVIRLVTCAQSFETLVILDRPEAIEVGIDVTPAEPVGGSARSSAMPAVETKHAIAPPASGDAGQALRAPPPPRVPKRHPFSDLEETNQALHASCEATLGALASKGPSEQARAQAKLGQQVIASARALMEMLLAARQGRARAVSMRGDTPLRPTSSQAANGQSAWLARVETYVASVVTLMLNRHVRQFRIFLYASTACALLLLAAISSYPFEPQRTLLTCIWVLMGAVVFTGLYVFVQLDRDPLLSHIAGHPETSGRLTVDPAFGLRVALWVVIPMLSVLAAQYPEIANHLAWSVEPFARALR
ncbi:MAG: hypothetical protein ABW252_08565 [Polyangiales bacterium]